MAYIEQDLEKDEQETGMEAPSAPSTIETGGTTPTRSSGPPAGTESGMFANIQKYVEANRPQAAQMAKGLTGGFGEAAKGLEKETAQKTEAFKRGAVAQEQARLKSATELAQEAVQKAGQEGYRAQDIASGEQFQQLRELRQLPTQYQQFATPEYAEQLLKAGQLEKQAARAATQSKSDLLRRYGGGDRGTYTRGQSILDEMLLQAPEAKQEIQSGLRRAAQGLSRRIGEEEVRAKGLVTGAGGLVEQARQAQQQVTGGAETAERTLEDLLGQRATAETERRQRIQQAIAEAYDPSKVINVPGVGSLTATQAREMGAGTLADMMRTTADPLRVTQEIADRYGVTPEEVYSSLGVSGPSAVWGAVDPEDILQIAETRGTQFATEEDLMRARALSSLAGRAPSEAILSSVGEAGPVFGNLAEWQDPRQAAYQQMRGNWGALLDYYLGQGGSQA